MTKPMLLRLASLLALVWIVTAIAAWLIVDPSDNLVAARGGRGGARSVEDLAPRDLHPAAKTLEKVALWGIRRDGSAGQPGAAKKTEEKPLEWRVIALVAKTDEKYLLVRIAGQPSNGQGKRKPARRPTGDAYPGQNVRRGKCRRRRRNGYPEFLAYF